MNTYGKKKQCPSKFQHSDTLTTVLHRTSHPSSKKKRQNSDLKDSASVSVSTAE